MVQINNLVKTILTVSLLLTMVTPIVLLPKEAAKAADHKITDLTLEWATGIISNGVGPAGIIVEDMDKDGITDIVSSSLGSVYVLNETAAGVDYYTKWYSEDLSCTSLATGDRDGDGIKEIYIGSSKSMVYVFRTDTFERIGEVTLPSGTDVKDIAIADVDNDGDQEIVVTHLNATLVYNANTLNLEWEATGKGGNKLGIGDIDGDLKPEIVVNNRSAGIAHVLNAQLQTEKWAYAGGFGIDMGVGDVDGDGVAEIAYIKDWEDAYVFEADTFTDKWHLGSLGDLESIAVADVDLDGKDEVLIGNGQWGSVRGYRGSDGVLLWSISNPQHGVFGIGFGDADNDGTTEILWGAGLSDSGKDVLYVGDWTSQTIQWASADLDGPLYAVAGDIDNDGEVEIVMSSNTTGSGYDGGTITVYNSVTHQIEWSTIIGNSLDKISQLALGQVDSDPALEIIVGYGYIDGYIKAYDGLTHGMQWQSPKLTGIPKKLVVKNMDDDPLEEIITGLNNGFIGSNNGRLLVFNGASPLIQWDSGELDGNILDISYGDLDGDNVTELAVLTSQSAYIYEVGTWTQKLHQAINSGSALAITNGDSSGSGELIIATSSQIAAWDGTDYKQLWQVQLENAVIKAIDSADLDGDGDKELVLMGNYNYSSGLSQSLLIVASQIDTTYLLIEYVSENNWGSFINMALADINGDGQAEAIFGSRNSIQVYSISEAPPRADFTTSPTDGIEPLTVQFTDMSVGNVISWAWDFNNDSIVDSTEQNPSFIYPTAGNYTVSLTVSGATGTTTETKQDYIQVIELQAVLSSIKDQVIELRGLNPKEEVTTEFLTREELRQQVAADSKEDKEEIISAKEFLLFLGFIKEEDDLDQIANTAASEEILGYYKYKEKALYVISDTESMSINDEFTFVHEYTHALQDQYFDLGSLIEKAEKDSEFSLAVNSLIEGDATLLQGLYYWEVFDENEQAIIDQQSEDDGGASQDIPPVIMKAIAFPYEAGVEFAVALYKEGGWEAINQAYNDPPQSAEQIIHPEKYLNRDKPIKVSLPDVAGILGSGWEELDNDVFGELGMRLYLETFVDTPKATDAAAGWGGDRYSFLKNADGRKLLAMRSVWDSASDADEFFNTYIAFIDNKSGGAWTLLNNSEGVRWWQSEGSSVYLSQTGEEVLIILAPDEATAGQLINEFSEFSTKPETEAEKDSGGKKSSGSGFLGCSCDSGKEETSTVSLLTGWSLVGVIWGGGYYMVRRKGRCRK